MNEHMTFKEKLSDYTNLSTVEQQMVDLHMATCAECAAYWQQLQTMNAQIRRMVETQTAYATRHYPLPMRSSRTAVGRAMAHPRTAWWDQWLYRTGRVSRTIGQLAGVASIFLFVLGLSLVFSGSRLGEMVVKPLATTAPHQMISTSGAMTLTVSCVSASCSYYRNLAMQFHKRHPMIVVDVKEQSLLLKDQGGYRDLGDEPMLATKIDVGEIGNFARTNLLSSVLTDSALDLSTFLQSDSNLEIQDFYPAVQQYLNSKPIFGIPTHVSPVVLLYNPKRFEEAGINSPSESWSVQDLFAAAEKLTKYSSGKTETYGLISLDSFVIPYHAFILGQFGQSINLQTATPMISIRDDELIDALQSFTSLMLDKHVMPNPEDESNEISGLPRSDSLSQFAMWTSNHLDLIFMNGAKDFDGLNLAALPSTMQPFASPLIGPNIYISKYSQHPEESWLWLQFLLQNAQSNRLSIPALRARAEQTEAWREWSLKDADAALLRSIAEKPILVASEDIGVGTLGNVINELDTVTRNLLKGFTRFDNKQSTNRASVKFVADAWQALLTKEVASETSVNNRVTITFMCFRQVCPEYEPLTEQFHNQNPGIKVELVEFESIKTTSVDVTKVVSLITESADTSIVVNTSLPWDPSKHFANLQLFIDRDPDFNADDFYPGTLVADDMGLRQIPAALSPYLIIYDKDAFDQAGIPYPTSDWTHADLLEIAHKLTQRKGDTVTRYGFLDSHDSGLTLMFDQLHEVYVQGELSEAAKPQIMQAIGWYTDLALKEDVMPNPRTLVAGTDQPFYQVAEEFLKEKKAAMWTGDAISLALLEKTHPNLGVVAPPNQNYQWVGNVGPNYAISAKSSHLKESWLWIKFLTHQRINTFLYGNRLLSLKAVPARQSVAENSGYWEQWTASERSDIQRILENIDTRPSGEKQIVFATAVNNAIQSLFAGATEDWQTLLDEQLAKQPVNSSQIITITFTCSPKVCTKYEPLAAQFHEENPQIQIKLVNVETLKMPSGELEAMVKTVAEAADTTMVTNMGADWEFTMSHFVDMRPFIAIDPDFNADDFYPVALAADPKLGLRQIPSALSPYLIIYDKDAFDEAGIPYPTSDWTHEELLEIAHKLTQRDGDTITRYGFFDSYDYGFSLMFDQLHEVYVQGKTSGATKPQIMQSIRWYTDLALKNGVMPNPQTLSADSDQPFYLISEQFLKEKKAAMWVGDAISLSFLAESDFNLGIVVPPNDNYQYVGNFGVNYAISAKSKHLKESWQWIKFLTHQPLDTLLYGNRILPQKAVPSRRSVGESSGYWEQWSAGEREEIERILDNIDLRPGGEAQIKFATAVNNAIQWVFAGTTIDEAMLRIDTEPGNCSQDTLSITQPMVDAKVSGTVTIEGVVNTQKLSYYELAYAATNGIFKRFGGGFSPVKTPGTLGEFETEELPDGLYAIRLQAADTLGNLSTPCVIVVRVEN